MLPIARTSVLRAARSQIYSSRALNQPTSAIARLLSTLAVLEQRNGKLQTSSLAAIAAAQKLGGSVTGFVAGSGVKDSAAAEAAKIKGLEKVIAVNNDAYEKVYNYSLCFCSFRWRIPTDWDLLGLARKLRSSSGREHQRRWLFARHRCPFRVWQESLASHCCIVGCAADFRRHFN